MASEDILADFSEEIVSELDKEFAEEIELMEVAEAFNEETELTLETEDAAEEVEPATGGPAETKSNEIAADSGLGGSSSALLKLPLARVRSIMRLDPALQIASQEAVFIVAKATELFIASLARESYFYTAQSKKKTIQKRDVDMAIAAVDSLMFLEGAMNF